MPQRTVRIAIWKYPAWKRRLDRAFVPLMYLAMGTLNERPQETHYWNNRALSTPERWGLDAKILVSEQGNYERGTDKIRKRLSRIWPLFHIPILGGWNQYLVLENMGGTPLWHVGWVTPDLSWGSVSELPLTDRKVRVLLRPEPMCFFALDADGVQMPLVATDHGRLGDCRNAHLRLL